MSYDDAKPMVGSYSPKSRRCCIVSVLSVALALVLILAIAIPVGIKNSKKQSGALDGAAAINAACQATSYPDTCNQTLAGTTSGDPVSMTKVSLGAASDSVNSTLETVLAALLGPDENVTAAASVCVEVLDDAYNQIQLVLSELNTSDLAGLQMTFDSLKTWLSAAQEDHTTCLDAFMEMAPASNVSNCLQANGTTTDALLSNALAFINALAQFGDNVAGWANTISSLPDSFNMSALTHGIPKLPFGRRRLLNAEISTTEIYEQRDATPRWMDGATRRHLLSAAPSYDVMVAADGSGKYKTIMDAVNNAPATGKYNAKRYTIYVKGGVYDEQVIIPTKLTNLVIIGDGEGITIITGSRSVALTRGMTTFRSATLIVGGAGFIGKSFTVQNTAGSAGQQACATRVSADKVAFYQVTFDSFQDTLYCHTFRQFYRECTVMGTVDFIFGNGNVVFQSSSIIAKKSTLVGQQNTYSAQGRTDPHQNTGLSFQDCDFDATADLKAAVNIFPTYLGRPWKPYSVCIHLRSSLQSHISPQGWLPWNTSSYGLYTSFFAEYLSAGPDAGANIAKRVRWSHQISSSRANLYQAARFISASQWLPQLGIPYSTAAV